MIDLNDRAVHYNQPQIECLIQNPHKLVAIMGRGTGKSTGIIAPRMKNCLLNMPGSNNGLLAKTFKQIKTRTLPATIGGWKKLGFLPDVHFVIGKKADKKLNFELPEEEPADWEHCIHWFTGAIVSMSSQDRKNDSNGLNLQSLHADEAKLLDYEDMTESIVPTLRGLPKFKNLVEYRSLTFTSDMPTTPQAKWLLDVETEMDRDIVDLIFQIQIQLQELQHKLFKATTKSAQERYLYQISALEKEMNLLRIPNHEKEYPGHTYFAEADSISNIDMLTPEYVDIQYRNLPDFVFYTSILNRRPKGIEVSKMFYAHLSQRHFYTKYNYNHIDSVKDLSPENDSCEGDADVEDMPLDLLIDWGGNINSLLVAQLHEGDYKYRYLKEFFALHEDKEHIEHAIKKFCRYYATHPSRIVNMYYDRNGNGKVANSDESYAEYAARILYGEGWLVNLMTHEENPNHSDKYKFFIIALSGQDRNLPGIEINSANCPNLEIALFNTPTKIVKGEVGKDKGSERPDSSVPHRQATHVTDAFDYGYYTRFRPLIDGSIGNAFFGLFR